MPVGMEMFWVTGLVAVSVGLLVLIMIVRRDLVPEGAASSFLDGGGRFFLGSALGIGIIAFTLKLVVVLVLTTFPEKTIAPLLISDTNLGVRAPAQVVVLEDELPLQKKWLVLPGVAPAPQHNPTTDAKVKLGRRLFNDTNLSIDRTLSCASCHDLNKYAGADGRSVAVGVGMAEGGRNTPTVINAAYQSRLFWDGRAVSLEEQAVGPLLNPIEMAMPSTDAVVERVRADTAYAEHFNEAFGPNAKINIENIAKSIAAYERSLVTFDAPIDHFLAGDSQALTPSQKRGMFLFRKLGCKVCHAGPNFSGASKVGPRRPFAYLRTDRLGPDQGKLLSVDKGRSHKSSKFGLWRIPSLRNVALTGPYLHNGSIKTLREVVTIMLKAQVNAEVVSPNEAASIAGLYWDGQRNRFDVAHPKHVTEDDVGDIVAFLHALSSDHYAAKLHANNPQCVAQATEACSSTP